ncbi:hypothetical protein FHW04_000192 [Pantoea sp. AN62]
MEVQEISPKTVNVLQKRGGKAVKTAAGISKTIRNALPVLAKKGGAAAVKKPMMNKPLFRR